MRYLGTAQLYAYLFGTSGTIALGGGTITGDQQALLGSAIMAAESEIDGYTRRNFAGTAGTYLINRFGQDRVAPNKALYLTRDLFSLISVTNGNGQDIPIGSVWLEPRNEGPPYRIVRLHSQYVWVWNTDADVVLAGTWGYGTVAPDDVIEATKQLSAYYYRLKDVGPGDVSGFPEGGQPTYPKGMPDTIKIILEKYRSRSGGMV